jgi:hypothetical protein
MRTAPVSTFNGICIWGRDGLPLTERRRVRGCVCPALGCGLARAMPAKEDKGSNGARSSNLGNRTYAGQECGTDMATGIKGSGLRDLEMFSQRWLGSKKITNHPLIHGSPMCGEVHPLIHGSPMCGEVPTTAFSLSEHAKSRCSLSLCTAYAVLNNRKICGTSWRMQLDPSPVRSQELELGSGPRQVPLGPRGALSALYYPYMPSLVPARGRDQIALRRPAAPPE